MCITRVYPDLAREKFGLEDGRVLWLADTPADDVLRPTAIVNLSKAIEVFLEEHPQGGVVLLDGLEYLILRNGYDAVLQFIEHLSDLVVRGRGIVLIPLSPATLDRKEVARVERDLELADTDAWRAELDAREWSRRLGGEGAGGPRRPPFRRGGGLSSSVDEGARDGHYGDGSPDKFPEGGSGIKRRDSGHYAQG